MQFLLRRGRGKARDLNNDCYECQQLLFKINSNYYPTALRVPNTRHPIGAEHFTRNRPLSREATKSDVNFPNASRIKTLPYRARNRNKQEHAKKRHPHARPHFFSRALQVDQPALVSRSGLIDPGRDSKTACERTLSLISQVGHCVSQLRGCLTPLSRIHCARDAHDTRIPNTIVFSSDFLGLECKPAFAVHRIRVNCLNFKNDAQKDP